MLRVLRIRDLAVAKDVCVEFENGFSVLTGETGAGKSVMLDGLGFILGERCTKDMIRPGKDHAVVSAVFDVSGEDTALDYLDEIGVAPDDNGEIEIIRSLGDDGRSGAKINGVSVSQTTLRTLGGKLISITSQAENRQIGQKSTYLEILDLYCALKSDKRTYENDYEDYLKAIGSLEEIENSLRDRAMMTDIYSYQLKEIDEVRLSDPDEETILEKQRVRLKDSERISKYVSLVVRALSQNDKGATAAYMIERAKYAVDNLSDTLDNAEEISLRLDSIRFELIDIAERVNDIVGSDMEDPEAKLDKIETRLDKIAKLKKKYGSDIAEILEYRNKIAEKLDVLESGDLALKEAEARVRKAYEKAVSSAKILSDRRIENAEKLSALVTQTLKYLDIPKAIFQIKVSQRRDPDGKYALSPSGYDDVSFLFTANSGYSMQELYKVASGGELSRAMLALKCALSEKLGVSTIVFDEIDTGVSGATSEKIGLKLKELSKTSQVICVTHSPQVASLCDAHYLISKTDNGNGAESTVRRLDEEGRVSEIARIIGGVEVTSKQIQAASEMIEKNT